MKIEYEYSDCEYSVGGIGTIAEAIYREPKVPSDVGNRYIEALPYPIIDNVEVARYYEHGLNSYSPEQRKLPRVDRRFLVHQIRSVRVALPFEQELEMEFYRTICESYRVRKPRRITGGNENEVRLLGDVSEAANTGFNMLGYSGCGKSSAIKILTSHYPQVILHRTEDESFAQIVYLVVSCQPNSNFSALYSGIGKAIDMALETDVYQKQIDRIKTLANKMNKVIDLIEKFGIGTIILDEIQLLDFDKTKESSFEALMVITNVTKMAFCVVGTTEAYVKMFKEQRTARRLGREINASWYCQNKRYFYYVMGKLFQYQWFDERIEFTEELAEAFYDESKGIVDQAVSLYIAVQDEYLKTTRKTISAEFVRDVSRKRYPNLRELLARANEPGVQKEIETLMRNGKKALENELNQAKQNEIMQATMKEADTIDISSLVRRSILAIRTVTDLYSEEAIEKACKMIAGTNKLSCVDDDAFIREVYRTLQQKEPVKKSKPKKKEPHIDLFQAIMEDM